MLSSERMNNEGMKEQPTSAVFITFIPSFFHCTMKILLDATQLSITLNRLAHQLAEEHDVFDEAAIVGIQPRGVALSDRLVELLKDITGNGAIRYGKLDITFYRDDVRKELKIANKTDINFSIENKNVVIIDDVLWTGRTIRAALDALLDFGRPAKVELCVLIDRRFSRELPIHADYVGRTIDTFPSQKVLVHWKEKDGVDDVVLV